MCLLRGLLLVTSFGCHSFPLLTRTTHQSFQNIASQSLWQSHHQTFLLQPNNKSTKTSNPTTARHLFNFLNSNDSDESKSNKANDNSNPTVYVDPEDPAEKLFAFFFGKKEEAPSGFKRFGRERFPEQYPATVDEWAAPLPSGDNNGETRKIRPLLKNTNLEFRALKLSYDANRDGWNPQAFHRCVDGKGPGIVLCTTTTGIICGGYNPKGWVGYGELRGSIAAFLFVINNNNNNNNQPGIKLRKIGGPSMAQMDYPEAGPSFGADGLVIPLASDNPKLARSKLGSYYERMPDGSNSLFLTNNRNSKATSSSVAQLKDLKVYHGVYEKDEFIPFTGADLNLFQ